MRRMAATISMRLLGRGTSKLPMYCNSIQFNIIQLSLIILKLIDTEIVNLYIKFVGKTLKRNDKNVSEQVVIVIVARGPVKIATEIGFGNLPQPTSVQVAEPSFVKKKNFNSIFFHSFK